MYVKREGGKGEARGRGETETDRPTDLPIGRDRQTQRE